MERDGVRHPVHVVRASDCDAVADLDRALKVRGVALLVDVHLGDLLVVGEARVLLRPALLTLLFDTITARVAVLGGAELVVRLVPIAVLARKEQLSVLLLVIRVAVGVLDHVRVLVAGLVSNVLTLLIFYFKLS